MIRLYDATETVFEHNKNVLANVLFCEVEEEEAGLFSATFETPIDLRIVENKIFVAKTPRGEQAFRIKKITKKLFEGKKIYEVYGRHIFYDLLDNFLLNIRPTNVTAQGALHAILTGAETPHQFSSSSNVPGASTANYVRMNPVQAIMGQNENSVLARWGGFLYRDNYQIEIRASSLDRGYEVRFGKNLVGINQDIDLNEVATRIHPTAVIDENTVITLPEVYIDSPLIGIYPSPIIREYRVELTDEQRLLPTEQVHAIMREETQKLFGDVDLPKINYQIDFVELSKTEQLKHLSILETLDLSDTVSVKVEPLGIDIKSRLIKYTYDGLRGRFLSMELGNFLPKLTDAKIDLVKTVEKLNQNLLDGEIASRLRDAINKIIGHKGGYKIELFDEFGIPTGTAYMDTDDVNTAQNYILINNQGIAFGNQGLANPPSLAIAIDGSIVGDGAFFNSLVTNLIASDLGQSLDLQSNVAITSRVTLNEMTAAINSATVDLASKDYVLEQIDLVNRANPNLVSNRSDRWEQGNIVSGALVESTKHIRTQSFFPIRSGMATIKVSPLYEAAIVQFDQDFGYVSTSPFATQQTINITQPYFKAVLKRVGTDDIVPLAIDTAELKVENASEPTHWTPYFGDLTLEEQKDFFTVILESTNGWTVDTSVFTTQLRVRLFLFNEDVTSRYPSSILWYRQFAGEEKAVLGGGTTYNVTAAETPKSATYEVVFSIPANFYYLMTKSGDRILTKGGDHIVARVADDPGLSVGTSKVLVRDYRDRILSAESSITQLSDEIAQKVEVTTFNAELGTVTTNITTLTTRATNVEAAINGATHTFTASGYVFKDANGNVIFDNALGMANEQNLMKHDDCEAGFPLMIPIHIGSSTSSIYQVLVKWKNSPFRSTAKSASAGGGTKTSASGGGATSGASSSSTTASGGATTSGASSSSTSGTSTSLSNLTDTASPYTTYGGGGETGSGGAGTGSHVHTLSTHRHQVTSHYHRYYEAGHSHTMHHTHSIGSHSHGMEHTHTIPSHVHTIDLTHVHDIIFGVVELEVENNALTIWIDGVQRGSVNGEQGQIDMTAFLQTSGWHTVELRTSTRKRIDANIFIKSYIRR